MPIRSTSYKANELFLEAIEHMPSVDMAQEQHKLQPTKPVKFLVICDQPETANTTEVE